MPSKSSPWEFWKETLKSPRCILAPMVDASELAWRLLSRRYGAQLAYTPMFNSGMFVRDPRYRKENMVTCPEDRPLIVQFCANDPQTFLKVARMVEDQCDAIDLNLGCPQAIARKGHYGSFLQDEWELISQMVELAHKELSIPITCKVRVFESIEKTVAYAQMLEKAGCFALTVHGRTREQKGPLTGLASWKHIQAVKAAVNIPVIANGNIQYMTDVERCIADTGVDGVMVAEGNLTNPALFANLQPLIWIVAKEYLDLVELYPCPMSYARGHLFKIFYHALTVEDCIPFREALSKGSSLQDFRQVVDSLEKYFKPYSDGVQEWKPSADHPTANLPFPPWCCQPYVRPAPEVHLKKMEEANMEAKRKAEEEPESLTEEVMSKSKMKKLAKLARKPKKQRQERPDERCAANKCPNYPGVKCSFKFCRACCRVKCEKESLSCESHSMKPKRHSQETNGNVKIQDEDTQESTIKQDPVAV